MLKSADFISIVQRNENKPENWSDICSDSDGMTDDISADETYEVTSEELRNARFDELEDMPAPPKEQHRTNKRKKKLSKESLQHLSKRKSVQLQPKRRRVQTVMYGQSERSRNHNSFFEKLNQSKEADEMRNSRNQTEVQALDVISIASESNSIFGSADNDVRITVGPDVSEKAIDSKVLQYLKEILIRIKLLEKNVAAFEVKNSRDDHVAPSINEVNSVRLLELNLPVISKEAMSTLESQLGEKEFHQKLVIVFFR